jgi:hypothetical protein
VVTSVGDEPCERVGEELADSREIPFLGHKHVDDLAELVDRPVQIDPAARDFDVVSRRTTGRQGCAGRVGPRRCAVG